jgi:hypothetical protein
MPLGLFNHSLNLANPVAPSGPVFRGYIRPSSTTAVNYYNSAGGNLTSGTHLVGTVSVIKTARLPGSNNQIVAIAGGGGRRVYHLNTTTNTFTSIFSNTSFTGITGCDIHMNEAAGKFYIVFCSSSSSPPDRLFMSIGSIASPTTGLTSSNLTDPGVAAQTVLWNPPGTIFAVRTGTTIRTYTRSGDTITLNSNTYSLSGGQTGTNEEDLSWNHDGTVLATSDFSTSNIIRYTAASNGNLTSLGTSAVPGGNTQNFPAFNPNSLYGGVMAIGAQSASAIKIMYFNDLGSGTLNSAPTSGFVTTSAGAIQVRWSPTGDKLALISSAGIRYSDFVYSLGSTATASFTTGATSVASTPSAFDWIYY